MKTTSTGDIAVFTYKEGLLSPVAHDLRLEIRRFLLELENDSLHGLFFSDSLEVVGVVRGSVTDPGGLSASERADVQGTVREVILDVGQFPTVEFTAQVVPEGTEFCARGQLVMRGTQQPLEVRGRVAGGRLVGAVDLEPSRWGIAPYRALFGAIRLQDRVTVRFDLPAPDSWPGA